MLGLIPKLPLYWAFRAFGWPAIKPFSVVVSVSFRCNSKCRTCDVWRKPNDDLTVEEWDKVFAHLGHAPFYMTFTGGEPFLRKDLDELVIRAYRHCRPEVITIPTNGMLTDRVLAMTDRMCRECPTSSIGINLSLDGIGDEHDDIRGVEGNWAQSMETWRQLKELQQQHKNLVLTVHTVVSRFNVHRFKEIYGGLKFLQPDSYITEVAEERVELDTVGWGITPRPDDYDEIADFLSKANPNWPRAVLVQMMNTHLSTTTDEVVARLTKNWDADTRSFDAVYEHILAMSDALSDGIIKQFRDKFGDEPMRRQ